MRRWPQITAFLLTLAFTLSAHAHPLTGAFKPETAPRGVKIQIGDLAASSFRNCLQLKEKTHLSTTIASDELFTGEQFDPNLGFYYLRARYYNPANGRFPTMDAWMGAPMDPSTLHKYLYTRNNPTNARDPSGFADTLVGQQAALAGLYSAVRSTVAKVARKVLPHVVGVGAVYGAAALLSYLEYRNGFPVSTIMARGDIERAAFKHAAQVAAENSSATEKPIGHHSIPIYMCGHPDQQLVPLKPSVHDALHASLQLYNAAINSAYTKAFKITRIAFSYKYADKDAVHLLAERGQGRALIIKHLRLFYNFGWFELGAPYFRPIFEKESVSFINGFTSSDIACTRKSL